MSKKKRKYIIMDLLKYMETRHMNDIEGSKNVKLIRFSTFCSIITATGKEAIAHKEWFEENARERESESDEVPKWHFHK